MEQPTPRKLTPQQALERMGHAVTEGTLNNWRHQKKGPPYVKIGNRVRYPEDRLDQWLKQNEHLAPAANDNAPQGAKAA